MSKKDTFTTATIRVRTPDGTMFVHISKDEPSIRINVGKSGFSLMAWAEATARLATLAMRHGTPLINIATEVSNITTDRVSRLANGVSIRSGPEGLAYAILKFIRIENGEPNTEDDEDDYRPGKLRFPSE